MSVNWMMLFSYKKNKIIFLNLKYNWQLLNNIDYLLPDESKQHKVYFIEWTKMS